MLVSVEDSNPTGSLFCRGVGWIADYFDTSPRMSSYLLCFIICDFSYVETVTPKGHVVSGNVHILNGVAWYSRFGLTLVTPSLDKA